MAASRWTWPITASTTGRGGRADPALLKCTTLATPGVSARSRATSRLTEGRPSDTQIVSLHQLVLTQLARVAALELDLAVDDDVAAIRDLRRLVEVLLGHEHGELVALLQLLDLGDHAADEDGRQAHRGLVHHED